MKTLCAVLAVALTLGGCVVPPPRGHHDRHDYDRRDDRDRYDRDGDARPRDGYGPDGRWDSRNCVPGRC